MGAWWARLKGRVFKDPREPIKGVVPRIKNIVFNNYRGILGFIVPVAALSWRPARLEHQITVELMWLLMFWCFLIQPVSIPATALIPIFFLPLGGVMSTEETCKCYFNENIALFILGSMLILLLNNSGYDRRVSLWFLCSGDACQFSGKRVVFKASAAAFVLSMFSNRLIVTSTLTQYVTPIFMDMKASYGKTPTEPNFEEMRYIINNAIQTSSALGSICILHAAYATLAFRAIWCEVGKKGTEYPDIFNFLQYTAYALPTAFVMWLWNVCYHMFLINFFTKRPMSAGSLNAVRNAFLQQKSSIPKRVSTHEKLTVLFKIVLLIVFFCRWNRYNPDKGWASYVQPTTTAAPEGGPDATPDAIRMRSISTDPPIIKDAVVAAMFVIILHTLPKSLAFLQIWNINKKSELKEMKPESGILFWRFVDQNTNYGYFFVIGSGIALYWAITNSGLAPIVGAHLGSDMITSKSWYTALFVVCLLTCLLSNIMTGVAALVIFLPLVIIAGENTTVAPWDGKLYLAALGVGVGASLGFMFPFMYTPAYFCHHVGKVPIVRMVRYSFLTVVVCMLLLWFSLCYWAPYLWDPDDKGIRPVSSHTISVKTTTAAPDEAPPEP